MAEWNPDHASLGSRESQVTSKCYSELSINALDERDKARTTEREHRMSDESDKSNEAAVRETRRRHALMATSVSVGVALGAALGLAMDNMGFGIAIGVAVGAAFGVAREQC
jgi:hypothetical protein